MFVPYEGVSGELNLNDLCMLDPLLAALTIFLLRCTDVSLYTLRLLMVIRGRKLSAWIFGFFQSTVFVIAIQKVLSGPHSWLYVGAYAAGFASGQVIGMYIEESLGMGYLHMRIVSMRLGQEIAYQLRHAGYGVTEIFARGRDGAVELLHCAIRRRERGHAESIIATIDPGAFITCENVRPLQKGFWGK
jgi:uncharacterized protein YebE (UPF0316 family)